MTWQMIAASLVGGIIAATVTVFLVACLSLASRADDDAERMREGRGDE